MIPVGYCNSGRILNMQSSVITYLNIYTIRLLGCLHHKHKTSCTCSKKIDFSPREPIVLYLIVFYHICLYYYGGDRCLCCFNSSAHTLGTKNQIIHFPSQKVHTLFWNIQYTCKCDVASASFMGAES